jgi:hypothetical protein
VPRARRKLASPSTSVCKPGGCKFNSRETDLFKTPPKRERVSDKPCRFGLGGSFRDSVYRELAYWGETTFGCNMWRPLVRAGNLGGLLCGH